MHLHGPRLEKHPEKRSKSIRKWKAFGKTFEKHPERIQKAQERCSAFVTFRMEVN